MTAPRPQTSKPPYSVPTMEEIRALPDTGIRVATTFAGGGGSSTGYRMAGARILWANEFVPAAVDTYRANASPETIIDTRDIRTITGESLLSDLGLAPGDLDILDGSPPCASFSMAGKRSAKWGKVSTYSDTNQRTDDLFFEFVRLVRDIQPKVFIAENVSGLVKGVSKGYFKRIHAELSACGYRVSARLLDASWLGVPQARQRLIIIGVRNDLDRDPVHPSPWPYQYMVRDVFPYVDQVEHLAEDPRIVHVSPFQGQQEFSLDKPFGTVMADGISGGGRSQTGIGNHPDHWQEDGKAYDPETGKNLTLSPENTKVGKYVLVHDTGGHPGFSQGIIPQDHPVPTIVTKSHQLHLLDPNALTHDPETGKDITIAKYAIGREAENLKPGESSDKYFSLVRPSPDHPSPTVTATGGGVGAAGVLHPGGVRKFTLQELRAICGFPPDYILTGSYEQRWERLGRSVPPLMMKSVAETVIRDILCVG